MSPKRIRALPVRARLCARNAWPSEQNASRKSQTNAEVRWQQYDVNALLCRTVSGRLRMSETNTIEFF
jgi:hypothetical protein